MKSKKFGIALLIVLQLFHNAASAASFPWIGNLNNVPLTIPANKILVIEQMNFNSPLVVTFTITGSAAGGVGSGNFSTDINVSINNLTKLASPIRLGPGMTIKSNFSNLVGVLGTVIDSSDFIAAATPITKGVTSQNGQLAALVDSRTSDITKTAGEASPDLQAWSSAGVTIAQSSSNPRLSKVITPIDAPKKFVRAKVTKRALAANGN